jgi:hypothetical protein
MHPFFRSGEERLEFSPFNECNGDISSTIGAIALGPISPRHYMSLRAQKDRQPRYSDNQRAYVPPEWSRRKNDWTEENQNMHNACGNSPASSRGLFLPDSSPCCSTTAQNLSKTSQSQKDAAGAISAKPVSGPCDEMLEVPDHFPFADYMDTIARGGPVVVPNVLLFREIAPH